MRQLLAELLSLLLLFLSPGLGCYDVLARELKAQTKPLAASSLIPASRLGLSANQAPASLGALNNSSAGLAPLPAALAPAAPGLGAAPVSPDALSPALEESVPSSAQQASGSKAGPPAKPRRSLFRALSLPSLLIGNTAPSGAEGLSAVAEADFALHAGGSAASSDETVVAGASALASSALSAPASVTGSARKAVAAPRPTEHHRSALFPLTLAGLAGALGLLSSFVSVASDWGSHWAVSTGMTRGAGFLEAAQHGLGWAAALSLAGAAAFAAYAVWEVGLLAYLGWRGRTVSEEDFWRFAKEELRGWKLHPGVHSALLGAAPGRGLLRASTPAQRVAFFSSFGMTVGGRIYLRPELIRTPWLFRWVLKHELAHYQADGSRAPPQALSAWSRGWRFLSGEFGARLGEWRTIASLRSMRIPALERVLREAQLSLRLKKPFEVLFVDAPPGQGLQVQGAAEAAASPASESVIEGLLDAKAFEKASDGRAKAVSYQARSPQAEPAQASDAAAADPKSTLEKYLERAENRGRFRYVVFPWASSALPGKSTVEAKRLDFALSRIGEIYQLARRLQAQPLRQDRSALRELDRLTLSLGVRRQGGELTPERVDKLINDLYYRVARTQLKGVGLVHILEDLYESLNSRGVALIPFAAGEPGLDVVERLLRYWQARDSGTFDLQRVDLPEGGHVLVARKAEPRVNLWLKPINGKTIAATQVNVAEGEEDILRAAGFEDKELEQFRKAGMQIKHVYGQDLGENRIFVSVHRRYAKALRRYAETSKIMMEASRGGYELHLIESVPLQGVDKAWKLGVSGEGGKIFDIDTGLDTGHPDFIDRLMESVDFVEEGPEDWIGHGSHKAGISYANGLIYRGMAPKALGRMGKVFSRSGFGASDGDIMAAAAAGVQWGADVLSLSLGSPGTADAPLALFFSKILAKKNANGHLPIGTGSAGNSGPFNQTMSQPSTGRAMISVAAAAKGLDDKDSAPEDRPEISFFSSVGFVLDKRFSKARWLMKPEVTGIGGDVATPPGEKDVYRNGVESTKSKDMPASPSDAADGKHVRMSGTSMSNPAVAGIAYLVKQMALKTGKAGGAALEFFLPRLPLAVKLILMRASRDMRVPIPFQGAGLVDAEAAVRLAAELMGGPIRTWFARLIGRGAASPQAGLSAFDWVGQIEEIQRLENRVYDESEAAKESAVEGALQVSVGNPDAPREDEREEARIRKLAADAGNKALENRFNEVRAEVLPALLAALKHEVWLVRFYAAFALFNLKVPAAASALADRALGDADGRVRQMAFLALGETPTRFADDRLKQGLTHASADMRMYAAYALAAHGDGSGVPLIAQEAHGLDKKSRFTAAWLLGQLGAQSTIHASEVLAGRVKDLKERGNIRHLATASLAEMAVAAPDAVGNEAVLSLLLAAGPQNFALTRTISKFFKAAARKKELRERMRKDPLKGAIVDFIDAHKSSLNKPGALGEMVTDLAGILEIPLDVPTPLPDPSGVGVSGVDPNLGPVHLIVELPAAPITASAQARSGGGGAAPTARIQRFEDLRGLPLESAFQSVSAAGLELETLERHDALLQAAMPASQSLWVSLPDAKVTAFTAELESQGYRVHRSQPVYRLIHETGPLSGMPELREKQALDGAGILVAVTDEGGDLAHPSFAGGKITTVRNFSDEDGPEEVGSESVGHGTHVMSTIAGRDASPYTGMAPGAKLAAIKVLGANGGSEAMVMAGMEYAASLVKDPLKTPIVINLSLGGPGSAQSPLSRLANALRLKDVVVVTAAGNEGPRQNTVSSPANAALSIAVAALDKAGKLPSYSARSTPEKDELSWADFGGAVRFMDPNPYEITAALSTKLVDSLKDAPSTVRWNDQPLYQMMSGTSMAAPHTSGKLAVLIQRMKAGLGDLPHGYSLWLEALVARTAAPVEGRRPYEVGAGKIDMHRALAALEEALTNPARIRVDAEHLAKEAEAKHGAAAQVQPAGSGWFRRLFGARESSLQLAS